MTTTSPIQGNQYFTSITKSLGQSLLYNADLATTSLRSISGIIDSTNGTGAITAGFVNPVSRVPIQLPPQAIVTGIILQPSNSTVIVGGTTFQVTLGTTNTAGVISTGLVSQTAATASLADVNSGTNLIPSVLTGVGASTYVAATLGAAVTAGSVKITIQYMPNPASNNL